MDRGIQPLTVTRTLYTGRDDLQRMQTMLAESIHKAGDLGYIHVGDPKKSNERSK